MTLRLLCFALSLIILLLTMLGLGIVQPSASEGRAHRGIVSAAPSAGANPDNAVDNGDNVSDNGGDNGSDNGDGNNRPADNRAADNRAADNRATDNRSDSRTAGGNADNADNSADNDDDDDDSDDDDDDDFQLDDAEFALPPLSIPTETAIPDRVSVCAPAGQETVVPSPDGRATVRVSPSMPQSVRITLRSLDLLLTSVPPTRGLRVGGLVVELTAEGCDSGAGAMAELPAEASLVIHYADLDVSALDEQRLVLAQLDPRDQEWKGVPSQVGDPAANQISATITATGLYTVYQP